MVKTIIQACIYTLIIFSYSKGYDSRVYTGEPVRDNLQVSTDTTCNCPAGCRCGCSEGKVCDCDSLVVYEDKTIKILPDHNHKPITTEKPTSVEYKRSNKDRIAIAMAMSLSIEEATKPIVNPVDSSRYKWINTNDPNQVALYLDDEQIGNWWYQEQVFKRLVGDSWVEDTCPVSKPVRVNYNLPTSNPFIYTAPTYNMYSIPQMRGSFRGNCGPGG